MSLESNISFKYLASVLFINVNLIQIIYTGNDIFISYKIYDETFFEVMLWSINIKTVKDVLYFFKVSSTSDVIINVDICSK